MALAARLRPARAADGRRAAARARCTRARSPQELELDRDRRPRVSSVLCAFGMLLADLRHDYVRSFTASGTSSTPPRRAALVDEMVAAGHGGAGVEGVGARAPRRRRLRRHPLPRPAPRGRRAVRRRRSRAGAADAIEADFHRRHEGLYGFASPGRPMEVIALPRRSRRRDALAAGLPPGAPPARRRRARGRGAPGSPSAASSARCGARRRPMLPGQRFAGPALVEGANDDRRRPGGLRPGRRRLGQLRPHRKGLEENA